MGCEILAWSTVDMRAAYFLVVVDLACLHSWCRVTSTCCLAALCAGGAVMTSRVDDGCYWGWTKWLLVVCLILDIGWTWVHVGAGCLWFDGVWKNPSILHRRQHPSGSFDYYSCILAHNEWTRSCVTIETGEVDRHVGCSWACWTHAENPRQRMIKTGRSKVSKNCAAGTLIALGECGQPSKLGTYRLTVQKRWNVTKISAQLKSTTDLWNAVAIIIIILFFSFFLFIFLRPPARSLQTKNYKLGFVWNSTLPGTKITLLRTYFRMLVCFLSAAIWTAFGKEIVFPMVLL